MIQRISKTVFMRSKQTLCCTCFSASPSVWFVCCGPVWLLPCEVIVRPLQSQKFCEVRWLGRAEPTSGYVVIRGPPRAFPRCEAVPGLCAWRRKRGKVNPHFAVSSSQRECPCAKGKGESPQAHPRYPSAISSSTDWTRRHHHCSRRDK